MLVKIHGAAIQGIDAIGVDIELTAVHNPSTVITIVGLPDTAVKESVDRVRSAIRESGYAVPTGITTINLAPADVKKEGSAYDLPIALAHLIANDVISAPSVDRFMIMGELSLDGSVRPIRGALCMAILARNAGFDAIILPRDNAAEAAVVDGIDVIGVENLKQVANLMCGVADIAPTHSDVDALFATTDNGNALDFSDVRGQEEVKKALEIACAGGHNILMIGSPGSGKSMMAKLLPTILPPLTLEEALETTRIHSVAGKLPDGSHLLTRRPFRAPHHTISPVALVGGGVNPMPGEISLAHNGVLFLDEFPEFNRQVLEVLRQPLEDGDICVSRAKYSVTYPARFMLVASMNPCPCGYYNHPTRMCTCPPGAVLRYKNRISGPLLDRIDLHVQVQPVDFNTLADSAPAESSAEIRARVIAAREIQRRRFAGIEGVHCNAQMNSNLIRRFCSIDERGRAILERAIRLYGFSARAYDRILRVARTIADLEGLDAIDARHIGRACMMRSFEREDWGVTNLNPSKRQN